jgi:tripartite-type tricarboxylate transporter receptor subunit TctC
VPLPRLCCATFLLWTNGSNPHRTLADLLARARLAPDAVPTATLGNGHDSHVAMKSLARATGVQMLHAPFKDTGALLVALDSGDVDITPIGQNSVAGLMASGRLRAHAVQPASWLATTAWSVPSCRCGGAVWRSGCERATPRPGRRRLAPRPWLRKR